MAQSSDTGQSDMRRGARTFGADHGQDGLQESGVGAIMGAAAAGFVAGLAASMVRKVAVESLSVVQGDWLETLKAEHRAVEGIFHQIHGTTARDTGKRTLLLRLLNAALQKHALEEENVIYPELRMHDDGARARQLGADHGDMKTYLHELEVMKKDDPRWIEMLRALQELVVQHVRDEEEDIYPPLRNRLSRADNRRLTSMLHREGMKLA
jgi:hemerythrin superfamily protein